MNTNESAALLPDVLGAILSALAALIVRLEAIEHQADVNRDQILAAIALGCREEAHDPST